ncbi:tryptophan--tRNA ligase, partial [Streptococcus pneumoniae]|nr:tryptophan--tRNA ligase [Streptococcus pneumoniae]
DMGEVYNMIQKGSERAREVAGQTLSGVKGAMGLHYFN